MHRSTLSRLAAACVAATFASWVGAAEIRAPDDDEDDLVPTGKGYGERPEPGKDKGKGKVPGQAGGKAKTNAISYHGGPVILGTTNIYYIWYGNWAGNTATSILTDLAMKIAPSPYYNINTTYYQTTGSIKEYITNFAYYAGSTVTGTAKYGTSLTDAEIKSVVSDAVGSGALPKDTNGVYFVLTSADVTASSGFCTQYCGWHTHGTIQGSNLRYSFVGNADRCPSACAEQIDQSPNGNVGADAMASIIAHELVEAVTDPDLNAWYDRNGAENADKCAWTFGTTYASNGALANMKLGSRDYLIQRNWLNVGAGSCALAY
jgi:hypothetical protein